MCPTLAIEAAADAHISLYPMKHDDSDAGLPHLGLFMVANGVGDKTTGEVAPWMAIHVVRENLEDDDPDETWPDGIAQTRHRDELRLMMSMRQANPGIREASQHHPETPGMATTFACVLLAPHAAYIAHTGDARIYRLRRGILERLTRERGPVEGPRAQGRCSLDALQGLVEKANAVTRALGCQQTVEIETRVEPTEPGDVLLACSDGLWGAVPERRIASMLAAHRDLRLAASLLTDCAHEQGGPDGVTCVLARIGGY